MKMNYKVELSEENYQKLVEVASTLKKSPEEFATEAINDYLKIFDGAEEMNYATVCVKNGHEFVISVDTQNELASIMACDTVIGVNDYDENIIEKYKEETITLLNSLKNENDVIPYPGSKNTFIRLATKQEQLEYMKERFSEDLFARPVTDFIVKKITGMSSVINKITESLDNIEDINL